MLNIKSHRAKRHVVKAIVQAHARWTYDREVALEMIRDAGRGFGAAGMRILTERFISDLDGGVDEALSVLRTRPSKDSTARDELKEVLHATLDYYFGRRQSHLLSDDPAIIDALSRAHDRIRTCAATKPNLPAPTLQWRIPSWLRRVRFS